MIKEPYMERFYSYHSKYINNILALRQPQHESLEIFARLCDTLSLQKFSKTMEQISDEHQAELAQIDNEDIAADKKAEKKRKLLQQFSAQAAADFYRDDLQAVRQICPTLTSFERDFPSFCFALATGIGKTRLMGACIAYLRYEKGIKNFFVMAPNLTIYNKLKKDLADNSSPKYVFRGLDLFATPPVIIDGDNYASFNDRSMFDNVVINIFNIDKLNSESKTAKGKPPRIKKLNEVLGESYFSYLQSLPDLCIFMDESHHYHADKSFEVINELRPILGVELTATPQIQKGARKIPFQNVVYEYSLAHALNDEQYIKVPAVFTRQDFNPKEYTPEQLDREKLLDGLRMHEETKGHLEVYARSHNKPIVKPFVLVVAKDTAHAQQLKDYIQSPAFFDGRYADKVMEIHSEQSKAEKSENIERLLSLEKPENKIEIVIHVNMLKEGWDVTNLYTIIPLRASASETLTEQTIGRGLRLPYGERTGVEDVDRLSIVSHDKYADIVNLAKDPNSLVRKVYYIDDIFNSDDDNQQITIALPTSYDAITQSQETAEQLSRALQNDMAKENVPIPNSDGIKEITSFIMQQTAKQVEGLNKRIKTFSAVNEPEAQALVKKTVIEAAINNFPEFKLTAHVLESMTNRAVETCTQALTDNVIPIPRVTVQPYAQIKQYFTDFKLDTRSLNWQPGDMDLIGTELKEGGKTFTVKLKQAKSEYVDTVENQIAIHIIKHDNVDYSTCSDLIFSLINDAKQHFLSYLTADETEKLMSDKQKTLADIIYAQMNEHFYHEEVDYKAAEVHPFSHIETGYGNKRQADGVYDLRDYVKPEDVRKKVFTGFKKACHTHYKFDSNTERTFAIVLEDNKDVLKWLRPAPKQFNIYYDKASTKQYEPDFIVETSDKIYMVETKARKDIANDEVIQKAKAGSKYCQAVSEYGNGKPWEYALIAHDDVTISSTFKYLIANKVDWELAERIDKDDR